MSSLWSKYKAEREGMETIEADHGFASFLFPRPDQCYLVDLFVEKEFRRSGLANKLGDKVSEIAVSRGADWLIGSVQPGVNGSTETLRGLLLYGMELDSVQGNLLFLRKKLNKPGAPEVANGRSG